MSKIIIALIIISAIGLGGYLYIADSPEQGGRPELSNAKKEKIIIRGNITLKDMQDEDFANNAANKIEAELKAETKKQK